MKNVVRVAAFALIVLANKNMVVAQHYKNTIASTDFDVIRDEDPSCFSRLDYRGIEPAEMPDKTSEGRELICDAYVFVASFTDNCSVNIALDRKFDSEKDAEQEALLYATRLGKLPSILRSGVDRLVVHKGNENTTAFSDQGLIVVYSGNAQKRIRTKDLEETLFHESVHAAWDKKHAKSDDWERAQVTDGSFISLYAKQKPKLEDLAESALFAYAVIHHVDRLPAEDVDRIKKQIPTRIIFVERLIPMGKPIFFDTKKVESKQ